MKNAYRSTLLAFAGMASLAAVNAAAQTATGEFRQTLAVQTPLELEVTTGSGAITIRQGAAMEARVVGVIRVHGRSRDSAQADEIVSELEANPPIELTGNRLRVGVIGDPALKRNVSISYEITVPAQTSVRSHTGSGSQAISGLAAAVTADTGSGRIELNDIRGAVHVSTGSGAIRAEGIAGEFNGSTGSGSVELEQTASAAVDVSTGSGSVRVRVPQGATFELDARTGSGAISTEHPLTIRGTVERNSLRGSAGSGGPTMRVRTGSGSVRIE